MSDQPDEIMTIDDLADYLKAGKCSVCRLASRGKLPAFELGETSRFRRAELDRWIARRICQGSDMIDTGDADK